MLLTEKSCYRTIFGVGDMVEVVEPSKCKVLTSNPLHQGNQEQYLEYEVLI
jgi:hypothetical protein